MVVHAWKARIQEAERQDHEFKDSLVYVVRPCLKKRKKEEERKKIKHGNSGEIVMGGPSLHIPHTPGILEV